LATASEEVVESLDLLERAGIAVEQEACGAVDLGEPLGDDRVRDLVADVTTGVHDGAQLTGQRRVTGLHCAEDVAGGNGRYLVVFRDPLGLRALTGARRAHDQQAHQRRNPS
jgi:hypothetical protein